MKNYMEMKKFSLRGDKYFCFVDTSEYLADQIFIQNQFRVYFLRGEYVSPDENYRIIFCHIRKSDYDKFIKSMEQLQNKMILLGYSDYEDFCIDLFKKLEDKKVENS